MAKHKVVLAYSGGLDTSIIIPWLIEHKGLEVHAVCGGFSHCARARRHTSGSAFATATVASRPRCFSAA